MDFMATCAALPRFPGCTSEQTALIVDALGTTCADTAWLLPMNASCLCFQQPHQSLSNRWVEEIPRLVLARQLALVSTS
jgi:hypothetical protein